MIVRSSFTVTNGRASSGQELDAPPGVVFNQLLFRSDSSLLAVGVTGGVFQTWDIPLNGSPARPLLAGTQSLALSHDAKQVAWLNERHEIWTDSPDAPGERGRFLYKGDPDERVAALFWSQGDKSLWFNRLRHCASPANLLDTSINPDTCSESDLVAVRLAPHLPPIKLRNIRLNSGFCSDSGQCLFLKENADRLSHLGFNVWSLQNGPGNR